MGDPGNDEARFRRLLEANRRRLAGVACSYASPGDAGKLFEEILLRIRDELPNHDGRADEAAWVYRLALATALTHGPDRPAPGSAPGPGPSVDDAAGGSYPVEGEAALERLRLLLAGLPPVERGIFLMDLDDLSYPEMADVTGLSVSNVGVKLHRVKQSLIGSSADRGSDELASLKAAWRSQELEGAFALERDAILERVRSRRRKLRRRRLWRDSTETAAAIGVALAFGFAALAGGWWMQVGAAVVIASAAVIVIVLHTTRASRGDAGPGLKHGLDGELRAVDRQIRLLRTGIYRFVAPLYLGSLVFGWGLIGRVPAPPGVPRGWVLALGLSCQAAILLGAGYVIWWLNRLSIRRDLLPLRDRILRCLDSLSSRPT